MIFDPYLDWLGFKTRRPVAGVHLAATHLTIVAVRRRPLRVVAVGRRAIVDAAVVGPDIRLVESLAATLHQAASAARIPPGTPTFATIEPLVDGVSTTEARSVTATVDVAEHTYQRVSEVVAAAGLTMVGVEPVPAALARLAGLTFGPASGSSVPQPTFSGLATAPDLQSLIDHGRDGAAIGAALAAFGIEPHVSVRPVAVTVGSGWTVQPATVRTIYQNLPRGHPGGADHPAQGQDPAHGRQPS